MTMTPDTMAEPLRLDAAEELPGLIKGAIDDGLALTPRSSTGEARIGRGLPTAPYPSVQVDLSGLDRILRVDRRERVALIEPGVTFGQLDRALETEGLRLCHPLLPPTGKSVLASLLDREPPLIAKYHWDFTDPLLCTEVYFGTGDRFRTGSAAWSKTLPEQWAAGMFQKMPLGPAQTDLAKVIQGAQGSMGIATWASVRVERRPSHRRCFQVTADQLDPIAALVAAITRRRLGDEILIADRSQLAALGAALGVSAPGRPTAGRWTGLVVVGALPFLADDSLDYQVGEVEDLAREAGVQLEETSVAPDSFVDRLFGVDLVDEGFWKHNVRGAFREMAFLSTLNHAEPLVDAVCTRWRQLGVDPEAIGSLLQPLNQGRCCHVEITAFVEPDDPALLEALDEATEDLAGDLADAGAFFSRPHGPTARAAYRRCPDTVWALHIVKSILDPAGVLAPGVLCFTDEFAPGSGSGPAGPRQRKM